MFDIYFFQRINELKRKILKKECSLNKEEIFHELEKCRSFKPRIFNVEPINLCNMQCSFCPYQQMTRKKETLSFDIYADIIRQIRPWNDEEWKTWKLFVEKEYKIKETEMSEDNFYLYVIPKVIVLHGYGESLFDQSLADKIELANDSGFETYFSCNPSNISLIKSKKEIFEAGLSYIKFSIDSTIQNIRGKKDVFERYYPDILSILEEIEKIGSLTIVVITMINFGRENQQEEWELLQEYFKNKNVYIYLKSQDQTWFENKELKNKSICWNEFCLFPWYAMSIKSNGEVACCSEEYNNEMILGNAKKQSLTEIWNSEKCKNFRLSHVNNSCSYCLKHCSMKMIGAFI